MSAAAAFVGFGFVDEVGDAWFGGGSVEVAHGALGNH